MITVNFKLSRSSRAHEKLTLPVRAAVRQSKGSLLLALPRLLQPPPHELGSPAHGVPKPPVSFAALSPPPSAPWPPPPPPSPSSFNLLRQQRQHRQEHQQDGEYPQWRHCVFWVSGKLHVMYCCGSSFSATV